MSKEEMVNKVLEQCPDCCHRLSNDEDSDTHDDDYLEFLGEVHEAFDLEPLNPIRETEEDEHEEDEGWEVEWIVVDGFVRDFIWRHPPG